MVSFYKESQSYFAALPYYRRAIEILLKFQKLQSGEKKAQTGRAIEKLLEKAEYCKGVNESLALPNRNSVAQKKSPDLTANPYEKMIEQEILDTSTAVPWESISGLTQAKEILQEAIIKPLMYPHIYTGIRAPPKGILLFGPPGTGKTLLAKAIASQCSATFFNISSSVLTSKNYGDGEKLVRALFAVAKKKQPSVIFIDEVDSILGSRNQNQHEASRRLETEFLVQMDGVGSNADDKVLLIAATNRPQELDEAVRRRLSKRIYIPLPDSNTRYGLIFNLVSQNAVISQEELDNILYYTEGFSGSDLAALCKEAAMDSVRGLSHEDLNSGRVPYITVNNFSNALMVIRPSVQSESLLMYEQWNNLYGVR